MDIILGQYIFIKKRRPPLITDAWLRKEMRYFSGCIPAMKHVNYHISDTLGQIQSHLQFKRKLSATLSSIMYSVYNFKKLNFSEFSSVTLMINQPEENLRYNILNEIIHNF